ncbi:hypothetical protein [Herbaspirillum sp. NPDC087042]|uniref:hypothetical protein n=1 Tax=Herbaspirillum sp. NPDC087042 TaxID=3364004 RepID=UPI00380B8CEC
MAGSKPQTSREKALLAMKTLPPDGYFEWDGKDEDDHPLTKEEMQEGIGQARKKNGAAGGEPQDCDDDPPG